MANTLLLLCFAAATLPRGAEPDVSHYVEKLSSMPDFFQSSRAFGQLPRNGSAYCAPAAASNALVWLDGNGCENLLPAARPGPQEQFKLIRTLGSAEYMRTDPVKGTGPTGVMNGIKKYCSERGYRALLEYAGWRTRNYRVAPRPTTDWMLERIHGKANLLLNIGWYKSDEGGKTHTRIGGHFLTAVGYERAEGEVSLYIHDPARRNHPQKRGSPEKCPVTCALKPLPPDAMLRKEKGDAFAGKGLLALDGIRLKRGADLAIVDGAIALWLFAE